MTIAWNEEKANGSNQFIQTSVKALLPVAAMTFGGKPFATATPPAIIGAELPPETD